MTPHLQELAERAAREILHRDGLTHRDAKVAERETNILPIILRALSEAMDGARAAVIEELKLNLEPGKPERIVAGIFEYAHTIGFPWTSSHSPLQFIAEKLAAAQARIEGLEAQVLNLGTKNPQLHERIERLEGALRKYRCIPDEDGNWGAEAALAPASPEEKK